MTYSNDDKKHMKMALKYAEKGLGTVEPNPAVGCIIVKGNQIIGKGWHKKFGQAHAEINAIEDCKTLGIKPQDAKMFVTLEPCCHHGKTGPCTEAIIASGIKEVFIATLDTSEHSNGKGAQLLKQAGIKVDIGLCQQQAKMLNAGFLKHSATKRPWVILKWAQTIDGKLSWANREDKWISNEISRKDVHNTRRKVNAIMVGINTVISDDPMLTPRPAKGKEPLRIVLDNNLRIPLSSRILNTKTPTMIVCKTEAIEKNPDKAERIRNKKVEILTVPEIDGSCFIEAVLDELGRRGFQQILVEGGVKVFNEFIKANQADEANIYIASKIAGENGIVDIQNMTVGINQPIQLFHIQTEQFDCDVKISGLFRQL